MDACTAKPQAGCTAAGVTKLRLCSSTSAEQQPCRGIHSPEAQLCLWVPSLASGGMSLHIQRVARPQMTPPNSWWGISTFGDWLTPYPGLALGSELCWHFAAWQKIHKAQISQYTEPSGDVLGFIALLPVPILLLPYLWLSSIKYLSQRQLFELGFESNLSFNISFKDVMKSKIMTKILIFNIPKRQ